MFRWEHEKRKEGSLKISRWVNCNIIFENISIKRWIFVVPVNSEKKVCLITEKYSTDSSPEAMCYFRFHLSALLLWDVFIRSPLNRTVFAGDHQGTSQVKSLLRFLSRILQSQNLIVSLAETTRLKNSCCSKSISVADIIRKSTY